MPNTFRLNTAMALVAWLATSSAGWAQATRTWVSGVGDDANPCSRTAPCKTFAGAISRTAAGGEISVIDPGGFGAVTITQSINIVGQGFEAGILVAGGNGIVINAGQNDIVSIRGLTINNVGGGLSGIVVQQAAQVEIEDCRIFGFSTAGINQASAAQPSRVHVVGSSIYGNAVGVMVQGGSQTNGMVLESTNLDHNTTANVSLSGLGAVLLLNNDSILASSNAIAVTSGSPSVRTYGNNRIIGPTPALTAVGLQ